MKSSNPSYQFTKTQFINLLVKCDDNEQHSRSSCLRIYGVEVKEKESEDNVMNMLEQCYSSLDVPFNPNDDDQANLIGLLYTDNHSMKKVTSIVVKLSSWKARQIFYKSWPRHHTDGSKKLSFSVYLI